MVNTDDKETVLLRRQISSQHTLTEGTAASLLPEHHHKRRWSFFVISSI